ncbi:MAG: hypothetical protein U0359_03515 [Byssovorax sp.]
MRRGYAGLLVVVLPLAASGCPGWTVYLGGYCPEDGAGDAPLLCRRPDAGAPDDNGCRGGECVGLPAGWFGPTWLWSGPEEQAPACDGDAYYEGRADFVGGGACEVCTCLPPEGSCALPSELTVSTKACNIPGGSSASFDAPAGWEGACDSATQVPAGVAHSLTVGPIKMTETACMPGVPLPAKVIPANGTTFGRACHGQGWSICGDALNSACIPEDAPRPAGFSLCLFQYGDSDCPTNVSPSFSEKHVFYDRAEESCTDCGCGPPQGSVCTATLSVYKEGLCAGSPFLQQLPISSDGPTCVDIQPPGQAMGSKSASPPIYLPGACMPEGGQGNGQIVPVKPATLCCRP